MALSGSGNLLEFAITAARNRCTVGEISDALENVMSPIKLKVWKRHIPVTRVISGAYLSEYGSSNDIKAVQTLVTVAFHVRV